MLVVDDLAAFAAPPGGSAVTVGAYDGVHIGHQRLIEHLREVAARRGLATGVVTFDRHPALVVRPQSAPRLLTDLGTKLELLAATGVDYTVVVRFDIDRSREPAEDFVRTVLVAGLDARAVAVGRDFHFGHNREGNVGFLERLGPSLGFDVIPVDLVDEGDGTDAKVSSTRVRTALAHGDVAGAAALLGRPHMVRATVVAADTSRLVLEVPPEICLPAEGAYAGWLREAVGRVPSAVVVAGGNVVEARLVEPGAHPGEGSLTVEFAAALGDGGGEAVLAALGDVPR
jgi:riboflavin kinase / FMN adenylyltransferase